MLKTAISDSSSISWVERKLCDPGIFVSFFKLLYPQYLEIGIFVEWMNRDIKPAEQMRSLRKKVLESYRAQHWAPGDMPTSGVWQRRRKRQSSFLWIPLTLENQSRGHVFLEHLLQSLDHEGHLVFWIFCPCGLQLTSSWGQDRRGLVHMEPPRVGHGVTRVGLGWMELNVWAEETMHEQGGPCFVLWDKDRIPGERMWAMGRSPEPGTHLPQPPCSLGRPLRDQAAQNLSLALQAATKSYFCQGRILEHILLSGLLAGVTTFNI